MFFVVSGVLATRAVDGAELSTLTNGGFFGELAMFAPLRRRLTSVAALDYGRLLVLSRRDFRTLARRDPEIERIIRRAAEGRSGKGAKPARRAVKPKTGPRP